MAATFFRPIEVRERYGKICDIQCAALRSYWGIDEEDLSMHIPGLTWCYDSRLSLVPISTSLLPIHPWSYIVLRNIQIEPNAVDAECELRIFKRSFVGHDHDILRLRASPKVLNSGGLDRAGVVVERPIIVPLIGCSTSPEHDDGIHVSVTNANAHFIFSLFNLLINVARRDFVADDMDWDFLDPQGNVYGFEPCNEVWNDYVEWSGAGMSEVTVWAGRVNPPVRARVIGVMLSALHSASVSGSYIKVQVSVDGSTWTDLWSVSPIPTTETMYRIRVENTKVKWIRVVVNPYDSANAATVRVYNVLIWA